MKLKCPVCKKKIDADRKEACFPFCSERCKLVDLNSWFSGDYTICSPIPDEMKKDLENKLE
ncbi:MAG: DNA gyrase inhibitor YacG [Planctomycetaceae bacterium]|nr:DNA gyrase inhibitor YacG [Planctomycetaceae bacterium]